MSMKTQEEYVDKQSEVSRKVPDNFATNLYMGKLGKSIPAICAVAAVVVGGGAYALTGCAIKKLLLSTDRSKVTIVTYRMFGGEKIKTYPRSSIQFTYPNKLRIRDSWRQYYLSEDGLITNKALYNHALQTFRYS